MNPFYFLVLLVAFFVQLLAPTPQEAPQVNPFPLAASPLVESTPPRSAGHSRHLLSVNTTNFPQVKKMIPRQLLFEEYEPHSTTLPVNNFFQDPNGATLEMSMFLRNGGELPSWLKFNKETYGLRLTSDYIWTLGTHFDLLAVANNTYGSAYQDFPLDIDISYPPTETTYTFDDRITAQDSRTGLYLYFAGLIIGWITFCSITRACILQKRKILEQMATELA